MAGSVAKIPELRSRSSRSLSVVGARCELSRLLAIIVALGAALTPLPSFAADGVGQSQPSRVAVVVAGSPEAVEKEKKTVTEFLSRLGLEVVVTAGTDESAVPEPSPSLAARAFVDLRASTSPWLVVFRGDSSRELERRTLPMTASLELSAEEVALVIYMAVESSLNAKDAAHKADAAAGFGAATEAAPPVRQEPLREETPPPPVVERTQPPKDEESEPDEPGRDEIEPIEAPTPSGPRGPFELELSAFGGASTYSASNPLAGFGAALDMGARPAKTRFSGSIAARAFLPKEMLQNDQQASLRAESARLFGSIEWEIAAQTFASLSLGGGVDRITVATGAAGPGVWTAGTVSSFDPVVSGLASAKLRLSGAAAVFVAAALDVDLAPHRYVAEDASRRTTFFEPARVRPAAFLGLSFSLVGGPRE